jgi:multisubunit Na+/H+ antiporter MnhB subunit
MTSKTNLIIAIVFVLFALVQYNDPDWYIWGPVYLIPAYFFYKPETAKNNALVYLPIIGFALWAASYVPAFINWIYHGTPTITGTMKADRPEVELMREFFGLIICIVGLLYVKWRNK